MGSFRKKSNLPGVEQHPDGQVSFTLTDEEQAEVDSFFRMMQDSSQKAEQGTWYIHPEAHKAMTAWALISYAQSQVTLAEMADSGVKTALDSVPCLYRGNPRKNAASS